MGNSFRVVVFNLVAHWADLDALKNTDAQALHTGDSDLISQLRYVDISSFLNAPPERNGQPRLRIRHWVLYLVLACLTSLDVA